MNTHDANTADSAGRAARESRVVLPTLATVAALAIACTERAGSSPCASVLPRHFAVLLHTNTCHGICGSKGVRTLWVTDLRMEFEAAGVLGDVRALLELG